MIGTQIDIVDSKNPTLNGLKGIVVDETKNTLMVQIDNERKTVVKDQIRLMVVTKNNQTMGTSGQNIIGKYEDRIRKNEK